MHICVQLLPHFRLLVRGSYRRRRSWRGRRNSHDRS
nr:MAG TPA: hypothetical protein [Caudoviricetes sp.]